MIRNAADDNTTETATILDASWDDPDATLVRELARLATTKPPEDAAYPELPPLRIPRHATPSPELQRLAYDMSDLEASHRRATMPTLAPEGEESLCGVGR